MMSNTVKMLQQAPAFQPGFPQESDRLFRWMEEICERVCYGSGAWVHRGHEAPDAIYLIRRGRVGVAVGEEGVVLRAGELFGELFFGEEVRGSYLARALEETELWVLRRERLMELLGERAGGGASLRGLIAYKQDLLFLFYE